MSITDRLIKGINVYIKNDAKAAAIASIITNQDCSANELIRTDGFEKAILGILPLLNNNEISYNSNQLLEAISSITKVHTSGKILYLLCGPSAVGKDTLASYAKHSLYLNRITINYVEKYTTRKRRGYEGLNDAESHEEPSSKYEYFKDKYDLKSKKKDASLGYSIYDNYYAFSGNHLLSADYEDKYLMCIYGRFENIHMIRKAVFHEFKRIPFSILLTAPSGDLDNRTLRRHILSETEQGKRSKEMKKQIDFIKNNDELIKSGFDLIIENGDQNSVFGGQYQLTQFIKQTIHLVKTTL